MLDKAVRDAALLSIVKLSAAWNSVVPWSEIERGFIAGGRKYCYASKALGIFKPKELEATLSIRTSIPKQGRKKWYRDQKTGELVVENDDVLKSYDLERGSKAYRNQYLERAIQEGLPLIYFHGIAPALYQPIAPVWGVNYDEREGRISLRATPPPAIKNIENVPSIVPSHSWGVHKTRNHQARFSTNVRAAYGWRCAFSNLPVRELLVGAHIIPDSEDGPASVNNGISMSTLHHSAFDANLIGIDPKFKIHVSPILLKQNDGKFLDELKQLGRGNRKIALPSDHTDWPKEEFLEQRFETFLSFFR